MTEVIIDYSWYNPFKVLVKQLLSNTLTKTILNNLTLDAKHIDKIVSDKYYHLWLKAFTVETIDPNENLEKLEYIGDRALSYGMSYIFNKKYPSAARNELYSLSSYYTSNIVNQLKFQDLGLSDFLLVTEEEKEYDLVKKSYSDSFEAFLGALSTITEDILNLKVGMLIVVTFLENIYFNSINEKYMMYPPITEISNLIKNLAIILKFQNDDLYIIDNRKILINSQFVNTFNKKLKKNFFNKDNLQLIKYKNVKYYSYFYSDKPKRTTVENQLFQLLKYLKSQQISNNILNKIILDKSSIC